MIDKLTTIIFCDTFPDLVQNIDLILDIVESRFIE